MRQTGLLFDGKKVKEHLEERFFNKEDSIWRFLEANMHENDYSAELEFQCI